jgi:DNA-binding transcriptional LysR family regulator
MSTYTKMTTFVTVIEENGFNQAAKKLKTSGAEISRRISALENELKVKLITRTTRRLTLTQVGEVYFQDCKRIMTEVNEAHLKISAQQEEPFGELSVYYVVSEDIFPYLLKFTTRYPNITLRLNKIERLPDFKQSEADVIIGVTDNNELPVDCVRKKIGTTRYVLCASPEYLTQSKPIVKPIDLNHHRYISHLNRPNSDYIFFRNDLNFHINPSLYVNDSEEMVKVALANMGLIWVHEYRVREYLQKNRLVEILPEYANPSVNRYMIYVYNRYLDAKIRAFVDFFNNQA